MSWVRRWQGKHVRVSNRNSVAVGQCDYTDFTHNVSDLVKQMEWRGDRLVWTGYMVGRDYLDVPNEALRPPPVKGDPYPVIDPRLAQPYGPDLSQGSADQTTQQIVAELSTESYWADVIPVSPKVYQAIPDGYPVQPTNVVVARLNQFHWGA